MMAEQKKLDVVVLDKKIVAKLKDIARMQAQLNQTVQVICETILDVLGKEGAYQLDFTGTRLIEAPPSEDKANVSRKTKGEKK